MEKKARKSDSNLTLVHSREHTPKEGEIMTKEQLKQEIADLKAREKEIKAEAKELRTKEKAAKAAAKAAGITAAFSRADATVQFIKGMGPSTLEQIVEGSNKVYADNKGSEKANNPREAKAVANFAVHVLTGVGCLTRGEDKKYTLKK